MKRIRKNQIIIIIFIALFPFQLTMSNGLLLQGNLEKMEHRTSYCVFNGKTVPTFHNEMNMSFEIMIREFDTFGYIFQIVDDISKSVYNFTYTYIDKEHSSFKFNTEGKETHASFEFNIDSLRHKWLPVNIHFDLLTGDVQIAIADKTCKSNGKIVFSHELRPNVCFGRREHIVDLPNFAIRNLNIKDKNQSYTFLLNESKGEDVHDINGKIYGHVNNPKWMINDSYYWTKLLKAHSATPCGVNYSEKYQRLYFVNQDSIYSFDLRTNYFFGEKYANELPMKINLGTTFLDEQKGCIYVYEVNGVEEGITSIAVLNLETKQWERVSNTSLPMQLHHHVGYLNQKEQRFMLFGGFGNRRYNGNFLSYNIIKNKWDTLTFKGDVITPRFFSSLALSKDSSCVYIYGGVGNESGDQSLGRYYYNDLYRVDLKKYQIQKCWNIESKEGKCSAVGDMVLSDDEKFVYIMRYPEYQANSFLRLYRFSVGTGESIQLGDSIPIISEEIKTNVSLFYNEEYAKCYCVKLEYHNDTTVRISIYEISTPPVCRSDIEFYANQNDGGILLLGYIGGILLLIVIIFGALYYYKYRKKILLESIEVSENSQDIDLSSKETIIPIKNKKENHTKERSTILLYGGFTVYDKHGRDITYMFSRKLKHIFIYILLNSIDNGVSSSSLNDLFWPDKSDDKVKNLKGVTTNHLRKILTELDGIELIYGKGYFRINVSEPCFCDYLASCALLNNKDSLDELICIWERGSLLEDTRIELFDVYRRKMEDHIFSILSVELSNKYKIRDYESVLRICRILFKNDSLNESALLYSVRIYQKLNQPEEVSKRYLSFIKEYQRTMGEIYPHSLNSLLTEK